MAHPYKDAAKSGHAKKLASYGGKTKGQEFSDTRTWDGEPGLDSGKVYDTQKIPTRKAGGRVDGDKSEKRLDKKPREGSAKDMREDKVLANKNGMSMKAWEKSDADKKHDREERASGGRVGKGKTTVNVIVSPQGGQAQPQPVPVPRPVPVPVQGPPPGGPPMGGPGGPGGMPSPGPGPGPGGLPPGLMRKKGGRVGGEGSSFGKGSGHENASTFGKQADGENPSSVVREVGGNGGLKRMDMAKRQPGISKKYASSNNS